MAPNVCVHPGSVSTNVSGEDALPAGWALTVKLQTARMLTMNLSDHDGDRTVGQRTLAAALAPRGEGAEKWGGPGDPGGPAAWRPCADVSRARPPASSTLWSAPSALIPRRGFPDRPSGAPPLPPPPPLPWELISTIVPPPPGLPP